MDAGGGGKWRAGCGYEGALVRTRPGAAVVERAVAHTWWRGEERRDGARKTCREGDDETKHKSVCRVMGRGNSSSEGDGTWQTSNNHRLTVLQQAPRGSAVQRESQHVTIARDWRLALHIQQQLKGGMLVAHAASPAMHLIRRRASPSGSSSTVACSSHDVPWSVFPLCVIVIAFLLAKERHSHTTLPTRPSSALAEQHGTVASSSSLPSPHGAASRSLSSDPNLLDRPFSARGVINTFETLDLLAPRITLTHYSSPHLLLSTLLSATPC